jgi:hypothetical protein
MLPAPNEASNIALECDPKVNDTCAEKDLDFCDEKKDPLCKLAKYSMEEFDETSCDPSDPSCLKY